MVYQGSKTKYCGEIIPILQRIIDKYGIEVFVDGMCGGCNIIDKFDNSIKRIAWDKNENLIDLYNKAVYNNDFEFPKEITREDWDSCKLHPEENQKWMVALTAFFTSYSARGFAGGYAMNGSRDYYNERLRNFKAQIPQLVGIEFKTQDIFEEIPELPKNTLLYLDPPYKNTKKYDISKNFNSEEFWDRVRELSKKYYVVVSEQVAPEDFQPIWAKSVKRNAFGSGLFEAQEALWIYKEGKLNEYSNN